MDKEPIIEELISKEEADNLEDEKKSLGYYFNCLQCQNDGYLLNKDQVLCPKCGAPFHLENEELEKIFVKEEVKYSDMNKIVKVKEDWDEKPSIILNKEWEDYITDAI